MSRIIWKAQNNMTQKHSLHKCKAGLTYTCTDFLISGKQSLLEDHD